MVASSSAACSAESIITSSGLPSVVIPEAPIRARWEARRRRFLSCARSASRAAASRAAWAWFAATRHGGGAGDDRDRLGAGPARDRAQAGVEEEVGFRADAGGHPGLSHT